MATFVYRCPKMGLHVQGWIAEDPSADGGNAYEAVTCTACRQVHLVNPSTGRVLAADDDGYSAVLNLKFP